MGRELDTISVLPEEVDLVPLVAADEQSLDALVDAAVGLGADEEALRDIAVADELLVAFHVGECPVGTATLVLVGGELRLEGRQSDGVCEAIDEEIQFWAVSWAGLPDPVVVRGIPVTRPG